METDLVEVDRGLGDDAVFDGTSERIVFLLEARFDEGRGFILFTIFFPCNFPIFGG